MIAIDFSSTGRWAQCLLAIFFFISAAGVTGYNDTLYTSLLKPTKTELVYHQKAEHTKQISSLTPFSTASYSSIDFCFSRYDEKHALRLYNSKSIVVFRITKELFLSYSWALPKTVLIFLLLHSASDDQFISQLG